MTRGGWHFRFQKRIQLMKGFRLNVSRSGVGGTVGGRLARFGVTAHGQAYQSASIPGTGISMRRNLGPARPAGNSTPQSTPRLSWWPLAIGAVILAGLLLAALKSV